MKRLYKFSLLLVVFTLAFFTKINVVRADNDVIKCRYMLPLTGVMPSKGWVMRPNSEIKCFDMNNDIAAKDCYIEAVLTSDITYNYKTIDKKDGHYELEFPNYLNSFRKEKNSSKFSWQNYTLLPTYTDLNISASYIMVGAKKEAIDGTATATPIYDHDYLPYSMRSIYKSGYMYKQNVSYDRDLFDSYSNYSNGVSKPIYISSTSDTCPQFISVNLANSTLNKSIEFDIGGYIYDISHNGKNSAGHGNFTNGSHATYSHPDNYIVYSTADKESYKNFLNNFYNIPVNGGGKTFNPKNWDDLFSYNNFVLPLYEISGTNLKSKTEKNSSLINDNLGIFRDYALKTWGDAIDTQISNLQNSCGKDNWDDYINLSKYKSSLADGGSKSAKLVSYGTGDYNSTTKLDPDKNITKECWNARSEYFTIYQTLRVFMYSIGSVTTGDDGHVKDDKSSDNLYIKAAFTDNSTEDIENNMVFKWDKMKCAFQFTRFGSNEDFSKCHSDSEISEEKREGAKEIGPTEYLKDLFSDDKCAYKCYDTTVEVLKKSTKTALESTYNTCTSSNISSNSYVRDNQIDYSKCVAAMNSCGVKPHKRSEHCNQSYHQAQESCLSSYDSTVNSSTFSTCMDEKVEGFSKDSSKVLSDAQNAYDAAVDKFNVDLTYKFEAADLLRFEFGVLPYEPNCRDVKFLTILWNIMIILAPFLLIIYSSFDYFKVVMAGDEEKMKVSRKKVPKRIIALVLLLVFPVILRAFVTKFGTNKANNTTYLRCVVTNDQGDSGDSKEESDDNNKDEKTKDKTGSKK